MGGDGAAKYYGYSTSREDFATLFATAMIKHDFDVDYYTAFVSKPLDETDYACSELLVGWGVRNRIADARVAPRARWVMESIYGPGAWIEALFAEGLGEQSAMTSGRDWCTNRDEEVLVANRALSGTTDTSLNSRSRQQLEGERRDNRH